MDRFFDTAKEGSLLLLFLCFIRSRCRSGIRDLNSGNDFGSLQFFADYYGATVEDLLAYYGEDTMNTTIIWQELMEYIETKSVVTAE